MLPISFPPARERDYAKEAFIAFRQFKHELGIYEESSVHKSDHWEVLSWGGLKPGAGQIDDIMQSVLEKARKAFIKSVRLYFFAVKKAEKLQILDQRITLLKSEIKDFLDGDGKEIFDCFVLHVSKFLNKIEDVQPPEVLLDIYELANAVVKAEFCYWVPNQERQKVVWEMKFPFFAITQVASFLFLEDQINLAQVSRVFQIKLLSSTLPLTIKIAFEFINLIVKPKYFASNRTRFFHSQLDKSEKAVKKIMQEKMALNEKKNELSRLLRKLNLNQKVLGTDLIRLNEQAKEINKKRLIGFNEKDEDDFIVLMIELEYTQETLEKTVKEIISLKEELSLYDYEILTIQARINIFIRKCTQINTGLIAAEKALTNSGKQCRFHYLQKRLNQLRDHVTVFNPSLRQIRIAERKCNEFLLELYHSPSSVMQLGLLSTFTFPFHTSYHNTLIKIFERHKSSRSGFIIKAMDKSEKYVSDQYLSALIDAINQITRAQPGIKITMSFQNVTIKEEQYSYIHRYLNIVG